MVTDEMVEAAVLALQGHMDGCGTYVCKFPDGGNCECARVIRAALKAAECAAWRPVETAPKDGTRIMLFIPVLDPPTIQAQWRACHEGGYDYGEWVDVWNNDAIELGEGHFATPTHWRQLPEPPERAKA